MQLKTLQKTIDICAGATVVNRETGERVTEFEDIVYQIGSLEVGAEYTVDEFSRVQFAKLPAEAQAQVWTWCAESLRARKEWKP